ncbi:hypothetical protein MNBD_CHLOROFLEXI01-2791 [hydrothermal vent metagenome]|uniref:Uncharacterized protein n=1 Tax=hydrothermal vent metagenome TaxID=652676 RepID=A0A3B0WDV2_9ZZZZ
MAEYKIIFPNLNKPEPNRFFIKDYADLPDFIIFLICVIFDDFLVHCTSITVVRYYIFF